MSVNPVYDLKMATPSKRYVDYEINGWMETVYKRPKGKENTFFEVQLPAVPSKSAQLGVKNQTKKEPNYLKALKRNQRDEKVMKKSESKTIQLKKVLKQKHLSQLPGYEGKSEVDFNSWHCKPLIKHSFKLKQNHFKSHILSRSFGLVEINQSNHPQTTVEILRKRNASIFF